MLEHHSEFESHPVQSAIAHSRDILPVDQNPASLRPHQSADQAQHGALSRAAAAEHDADPPARKRAGEALENGTSAVSHVDVIEGYVGVAGVCWGAQGAVRNAHRLQSSSGDVEIRSAQRFSGVRDGTSVVQQRGHRVRVVDRLIVAGGIVGLSGAREFSLRSLLESADADVLGICRADTASRVPEHQ